MFGNTINWFKCKSWRSMLDSRMGIDFMERKTSKQIAISWSESDVETILSPTQENFIKNYHKPRDKWPSKGHKVDGKNVVHPKGSGFDSNIPVSFKIKCHLYQPFRLLELVKPLTSICWGPSWVMAHLLWRSSLTYNRPILIWTYFTSKWKKFSKFVLWQQSLG